MTTDLIFHIGLTKTASSMLQTKVFQGKMHTLHRAIEWEKDREHARSFREAFRGTSCEFWENDGADWFDSYDPDPSLGPVIISHETLYENNPFGAVDVCLKAEPTLMAGRFRSIASHAWPHGQTKVWFFYRRQAGWLPSMYAHVCYMLPEPSQSDFEARTRDFIESGYRGSHTLEYDLLYDALESALGEDNVLALPFEAIGEEWVWEKVRDFTGEKSLVRDARFDQRDVNVKRQPGESDWRLSGNVQKWTNIRLGGVLRGASACVPDRVKNKVKKRLLKRVGIPAELEAEITARYRESNKRMSERTGVDLEMYGYL